MNSILMGSAGLVFILTLIPAHAQTNDKTFVEIENSKVDTNRTLGVVTISESAPSSLPAQIPTTMESVKAEDIDRTINAVDLEDALKYLPSVVARKRFIGDWRTLFATRASGTGNTAREAIYLDGMLISNFLGNGNGGLGFFPAWGLANPEEIERIDLMYGPFSAAYPGNSIGAVVDIITKMPTQFEFNVNTGYQTGNFNIFNTSTRIHAAEASMSLGNKNGPLSWQVGLSRTESKTPPEGFPSRLISSGVAGNTGTVVNGALSSTNSTGQPIYILGTANNYWTQQDLFKVKIVYDLSSTLRASYIFGAWTNSATAHPSSYLSNGAGTATYSGPINIAGTGFSATQSISGSDFPVSAQSSTHYINGFSLKSNTQGEFDWEADGSIFNYKADTLRANTTANAGAATSASGPGTILDAHGSGWNNLGLRGVWRPDGMKGRHIVDFGLQQNNNKLILSTSNIPGNFLSGDPGNLINQVGGQTHQTSLYIQDSLKLSPAWQAVLGIRDEHWRAADGQTTFSPGSGVDYSARAIHAASPKLAVSFEPTIGTVLKLSTGRAVRMPTVNELYGATSTVNSRYLNNPNLKPEKSWATELSLEKTFEKTQARASFFTENLHNAIYSQTLFNSAINSNITSVQNIDRIAMSGLELAVDAKEFLMRQFDLGGSVTFVNSVIKANAGFVTSPGDTIGKQQPEMPKIRAKLLADYHWNERWNSSVGVRYSGRQFRTENNSDVNQFAYQGISKFFIVDLRARYKVNKELQISLGIDNVNNYKAWDFYPYPQRTYSAQLKYAFR
jgi:iron complex outermembrane receptor protein